MEKTAIVIVLAGRCSPGRRKPNVVSGSDDLRPSLPPPPGRRANVSAPAGSA